MTAVVMTKTLLSVTVLTTDPKTPGRFLGDDPSGPHPSGTSSPCCHERGLTARGGTIQTSL
jgi:hypothetical protein